MIEINGMKKEKDNPNATDATIDMGDGYSYFKPEKPFILITKNRHSITAVRNFETEKELVDTVRIFVASGHTVITSAKIGCMADITIPSITGGSEQCDS